MQFYYGKDHQLLGVRLPDALCAESKKLLKLNCAYNPEFYQSRPGTP